MPDCRSHISLDLVLDHALQLQAVSVSSNISLDVSVLDATVIYRRHACRYACLLSSEKGAGALGQAGPLFGTCYFL